jgi:hypothetical protein
MNFVLRTHDSKGVPSNQSIGHAYVYIDKDRHPEDFQEMRKCLNHDPDEKTYGYVSYADGSATRSLFIGQENYIVSENGQTYENLTHIDDRQRKQ